MGLDSVEIVMAWEEAFGISIPDADACNLVTPRHAIDYSSAKLNAPESAEHCLAKTTFHAVRQMLNETGSIPAKEIRLSTKLQDIFRSSDRTTRWSSFARHAGLATTTYPWGLKAMLFGPRTVEDLVFELLSRRAASVRKLTTWSRSQVREVVREIVREQIGVRRFSDHDEFVRDLGID